MPFLYFVLLFSFLGHDFFSKKTLTPQPHDIWFNSIVYFSDASSYWASYYNYYSQEPVPPHNYYTTAAAYGAWGDASGWGSGAPPFQPPPPSQPPPPPPPPEEDIPPPPPGAPSDSAQPNPKRSKTIESEETAPPTVLPPPPTVLPTPPTVLPAAHTVLPVAPTVLPVAPVLPSVGLPGMLPTDLPPPPPGTVPTFPKADKDACGYYDNSTETWDRSIWNSDTTTFVVSAGQSGPSDQRTGKSHVMYLINFKLY